MKFLLPGQGGPDVDVKPWPWGHRLQNLNMLSLTQHIQCIKYKPLSDHSEKKYIGKKYIKKLSDELSACHQTTVTSIFWEIKSKSILIFRDSRCIYVSNFSPLSLAFGKRTKNDIKAWKPCDHIHIHLWPRMPIALTSSSAHPQPTEQTAVPGAACSEPFRIK